MKKQSKKELKKLSPDQLLSNLTPNKKASSTMTNLSSSKKQKLYNLITQLVNNCIQILFRDPNRPKKSQKLTLFFEGVQFNISQKCIEIYNHKSKTSLSYSIHSNHILVNNVTPLPDSHCHGYIIWINTLVKALTNKDIHIQHQSYDLYTK